MKIIAIKQEYFKKIEKINLILNAIKNIEDDKDITDIFSNKIFYNLISEYSTQIKAPLSDKRLIKYFNLIPVSAKENRGDAKDKENLYYEFKTSFTNKGNNLNIRQIRLWQNIDYYYCFFINEDDVSQSLFFKLSHQEMKKEVELCGSATHGTKKANINNDNIEYSITVPVYNLQNEKTIRWRKNYLQGGKLWD